MSLYSRVMKGDTLKYESADCHERVRETFGMLSRIEQNRRKIPGLRRDKLPSCRRYIFPSTSITNYHHSSYHSSARRHNSIALYKELHDKSDETKMGQSTYSTPSYALLEWVRFAYWSSVYVA